VPETVEAKIPSVLGFFETLTAMGINIGIVLWTGQYWPLAISACVAPLLLLRTPESTRRGPLLLAYLWSAFGDLSRRMKPSSLRAGLLGLFLIVLFSPGAIAATLLVWRVDPGGAWRRDGRVLLVVLAVGLVIFCITTLVFLWELIATALALPVVLSTLIARVGATATAALRQPLAALREIPMNWFRIVACQDMHCSAELMPGLTPQEAAGLYQQSVTEDTEPLLDGPLLRKITIGLTAPALLYRWSLKGTALVWLPLLWAVAPASSGPGSRDRLEDFRQSVVTKLLLTLSSFALLVGCARLLFSAAWNKTAAESEALTALLPVQYIHIWHICALVNSLLFWALFIWADKAWRRPRRFTDTTIDRVLSSTLTVRRVLTLYTSLSVLRIVLELADFAPHLRFSWELLPV